MQSPNRAFLFLLYEIERLERPVRQWQGPDKPMRIRERENDRQRKKDKQQYTSLLPWNVQPYNHSTFTVIYICLLTFQHIDYSIWVFKDGIKWRIQTQVRRVVTSTAIQILKQELAQRFVPNSMYGKNKKVPGLLPPCKYSLACKPTAASFCQLMLWLPAISSKADWSQKGLSIAHKPHPPLPWKFVFPCHQGAAK